MTIKLYWAACGKFAIEETGAYFLEATKEEVETKLLPRMNKQELIKFETMKDVYVAPGDTDLVKKGRYYFLVSDDAQDIKFESSALPAAEFARGNSNLKPVRTVEIERIEDIETVKPEFV